MWVRLAPARKRLVAKVCRALVGHPPTEVERVDPGVEPGVEPLVGQRDGAVVVAVGAGEQRQPCAFGAAGPPAVFGGETVKGSALTFGEDLVQALGDSDGGVVVADLGLVVPEHG